MITSSKYRLVTPRQLRSTSTRASASSFGKFAKSHRKLWPDASGSASKAEASAVEWAVHIVAVPWKLIFALVPPTGDDASSAQPVDTWSSARLSLFSFVALRLTRRTVGDPDDFLEIQPDPRAPTIRQAQGVDALDRLELCQRRLEDKVAVGQVISARVKPNGIDYEAGVVHLACAGSVLSREATQQWEAEKWGRTPYYSLQVMDGEIPKPKKKKRQALIHPNSRSPASGGKYW